MATGISQNIRLNLPGLQEMPVRISEAHRSWLAETFKSWQVSRFRPLLRLQSHAEEGGGEPRWLLFCDYLAKAMVNLPDEDWLQEILHASAQQLWAAEAETYQELVRDWFAQSSSETIERAFAVASWIGQRYRSLPLN